jgi:hypothetical protein
MTSGEADEVQTERSVKQKNLTANYVLESYVKNYVASCCASQLDLILPFLSEHFTSCLLLLWTSCNDADWHGTERKSVHCCNWCNVPRACEQAVCIWAMLFLSAQSREVEEVPGQWRMCILIHCHKHVIESMVNVHMTHIWTTDMGPLTTSFVTIELTFLIKHPISHFVNGHRSNGLRELYQHTMPTTQGDINNYIKFFLDAIDGIFFGTIEMLCL